MNDMRFGSVLINREVLAYDAQAEDEEGSLTALEGHKLPPGILHHGMPTVTDVQPASSGQAGEQPPPQPQKAQREYALLSGWTLEPAAPRACSRAGELQLW